MSKGVFQTTLKEKILKNIVIKSVITNLNFETKGFMNKDYYGLFFCSFTDNVLMNNVHFDKSYLSIVPPGKEYYKLTKNKSTQFSLTIKKERFLELFSIYNFQIIELNKNHFGAFLRLINSLLESQKKNEEDIDYQEFLIMSYLKLFFKEEYYLNDRYKYFEKFHKIVNYIKSYNLFDISIEELAFKFKISDRTLRNIFYTCAGMSPKKYLRILQLNNLRKNLFKNDIKISQIIIDENLPTQSQITKEFKEHFLKTPSSYKKTLNPLIK